MNTLLIVFVLLVFALLNKGVHAGGFCAAETSYVEQLLINGQLTQQQVITVTCSDQVKSCILNAGTSEVEIFCNAPELFFSVQEIAAVPLITGTGLAKACEVGDLDVFASSANATGTFFNEVIQSQSTGNGVEVASLHHASMNYMEKKSLVHRPNKIITIKRAKTHNSRLLNEYYGSSMNSMRRRKLLFFDPISAVGVGYALYEIETLKGQMSNMDGRITNNERQLENLTGSVSQLTNITAELVKSLGLQTNINIQTHDQLEVLRVGELHNAQSILATNQAVNQSVNDMKSDLTTFILNSKAALLREHNVTQQEFADVYNEISNLYTLNGNLTLTIITMLTRLASSISAQGTQTRSTASLLWDEAKGVGLDRLLTSSLYKTKKALPVDMIVLKTDDGTEPHEGTLNGTYARFFIEHVVLNWVQDNSPGGTTSQTAFRMDFDYWTDTMFGLHNDKPWNTWDDFVNVIGPGPVCLRPHTDADFPLDAGDINATLTHGPGCTVWIESVQTACQIQTAQPHFEFTLATSGALDSTVCQAGSTQTFPRIPIVYRDILTFNQKIGDLYANPLRPTNANTIKILFQRSGSQRVLPGPKRTADAYLTFNVAQTVLDYTSLQMYMNEAFVLSFPFIRADLLDREQFIYGRAFDGTDRDISPISNTPTRRIFNNDTQQYEIVYDGAAKRTSCEQLEYRYVHPHAIELNAAEPLASRLLNIKVDVITVTPTNGATSIPITTHDVALSATYNIDGANMIPPNFFYFGSLDPSVYNVGFDVPDKFICGVNKYATCKGKMDEYWITSSDDNPTRLTPSLLDWVNEFPNDRIYHPRDIGGSLADFMRRLLNDTDGYPQCNTAGGITNLDLITNSLLGDVKPSCRGAFQWFEGVVGNQEIEVTTAHPGGVALLCNNQQDPGELWYTDNTQLTTANTSGPTFNLLSPWSFSFQYETIQSSFQILNLITSNVQLIITGGSNLIINANNGQASVSIPVHHEIDDSIHNLWIQWDPTNGINRLMVYIDLIPIYSSVNFNIQAAVGLPTASVFIFPTGGLTPGLTDRIFAFRAYTSIYTTTEVLNFGSCQYSKSPTKRCDIPLAVVNSVLPNTRETLYVYQIPNPDTQPQCYIYDNVLLSDPIATKNIALQSSGDFSYTISWFSDRVSFSSTVFIPIINVGGWAIMITRTSVRFQSLANSNTISTYTNVISNSGLDLSTTSAHWFTLVSSATSGTPLRFFIDKVELAVPSGGWNQLVTTGIVNVQQAIVFTSQFTMGRYYPNTGLQSIDLPIAFKCGLGSTIVDSSQWRTPLATCIASPYSIQSGYCRHSSMCNGKCSGYTSHLDRQAGTFYLDSVQCDARYEGTGDGSTVAPCQTVCPRQTTAGYCLSDDDTYKPLTNRTDFGNVPGSEFCNILKHFQVRELPVQSNGQRIISMKPRKWLLRPVVRVPQGNIVSTIATGQCPETTPTAKNSSVLAFKMFNPALVDTTVRVHWISTASSPAQDDVVCSHLYTQTSNNQADVITIPAGGTQYFTSPPCGTTEIQVQRLVSGDPITGWENCGSPYLSAQFPQIFDSTIFVPDTVDTAIRIAQSETQVTMNRLFIQSLVNQLQLTQFIATATNAGQAMLAAISQFQAYAAAKSATNSPLDINEFFNQTLSTGGPTFYSILLQSSQQAQATSEAAMDRSRIDAIENFNNQLILGLGILGYRLGNLTIAEDASFAAYTYEKARLAAQARGLGGSNPFGFIGAGGNYIGGTLLPGLAKGLTALLEIPFGLGSALAAGLGSVITAILEALLVIAAAVLFVKFGLPLVEEWWKKRKERKKQEAEQKKKKQEEEKEKKTKEQPESVTLLDKKPNKKDEFTSIAETRPAGYRYNPRHYLP